MAHADVDKDAAFAELHEARRDLLAVLEGLHPNDWDKPTSCGDWSVREVVAHIAATPDAKLARSLLSFMKTKGRSGAAADAAARELGKRPVVEILDHYRANVDSTALPLRMAPEEFLTDVVIHSLDICHPNGWDLELPADRMRLVLSTMVTLGAPFHGRERCEALRLETTDIDWRCGCGDGVRGPSRQLLLAMAGRTSACDQLSGDGVTRLAERS